MIRNSLLRRLLHSDFENLLNALTARQHIAPHERVATSLAATVDELGVCPQAIERAIDESRTDLSATFAIKEESARLREELVKLRAEVSEKIADMRADIIKWMSILWAGQLAAMLAFFKLFVH